MLRSAPARWHLVALFVTLAGCMNEGNQPKPPSLPPTVADQEYLPQAPAVTPEPAEAPEASTRFLEEKPAEEKPAPPPPEVAGLPSLSKDGEIWLDVKGKRVLIGGRIVRTEGQLEMFACLKNTKEHESIVAANTKAVNVNAALIALGATPGGPVQFRPEFKPASGPEVEVTVIWTDKDGKRQQARGQDWIRNLKDGKTLTQPWVFGGSGFWVDETSGEKHFMAEDGDFICISNFTSAMLDLPVESSQATADLQFEAFTERIPPVNTPVLLVLTPKLKPAEQDKEAAKPASGL